MPMLRIAVPTQAGRFSPHFGGAERFSLYEVDERTRAVVSQSSAVPPPHERGAFPTWLKEQGANVILAGGMGPRAVQIFRHFGIETVLGVTGGEPDQLVRAYLDGTLVATGEGCGGGGLHDCGDHHDR
jgi:predicted Fe-Mo cluster-binding NifX family protein